jgi:hypothetical protein
MAYLEWHGRKKTRGDDISDVISGEFFPDDDRPSLPLVREALQNAIDAGRTVDRGSDPVRVRIALRTQDSTIPQAVAKSWFQGLWPHVSAERNGLKDAPELVEPCGVLVVEDFGTVGLTGDVASDEIDGAQNNFVDFLRSDGRTRKTAGEQGSWGVGKNVFPRCSRINSYIAFTVRRDDGRHLLMGKCVLKIRRVGGDQYQPPIYLCESWERSEVPMPHHDPLIIAQFCEEFPVSRRNEPGLSLVMPWVNGTIRPEDIIQDIVSQFYPPILAGQLHVELDLNGELLNLTSRTLLGLASSRESLASIRPHIELASWAQSRSSADHLVILPPSDPAGPQRWDRAMIPESIRSKIAETLEQRRRVAVRVPIHTRRAGGTPVRTHLSVYLEHDDSPQPDSRPRFFREMLCINEVRRAAGAARTRALVLIEDQPLAELLRNAEPPNHSDWTASTANFKGSYVHGNHVVTFVKSSVRSLMALVRGADGVPDARIAIDYFSKRGDQQAAKQPERHRRTKDEPASADVEPAPEPPSPPPPTPKQYRLTELETGFSIRSCETARESRLCLCITMAYDVLAGSAWKQYEPADFDLTREDRSQITIAASSGTVVEVVGTNRLLMRAEARSFALAVTGFDPNRDLIVSVRPIEENADDDSTVELHEEA